MGLGHVPQEPLRAEGEGADVQGRQRRGTAAGRPVDLARQARGRWGEDQADRWYRSHGYDVLDRNWRCAAGELDLVVRTGGGGGGATIVFVEVKARAGDWSGLAAEAVNHRKQRTVRIVAARWFAAHPEHHGQARFDVVAVTGVRVEVLVDAF